MRIAAIVAALVVVLATGIAASGQDRVTPAARSISWASEADLRALFKDAATVKRFLNEVANEGDPAGLDATGTLHEYRLVDLDRDGWFELVALCSQRLSTFLMVVFETPNGAPMADRLVTQYEGFVLRSLNGFGAESLSAVFRDLDQDGTDEIVMPELLGAFEGAARPQATLPEVYAWKGEDFAQVSARYPEFYRDEVLPPLERQLQKLEALPSPSQAYERAERRALREKYAREIAEARKRAAGR